MLRNEWFNSISNILFTFIAKLTVVLIKTLTARQINDLQKEQIIYVWQIFSTICQTFSLANDSSYLKADSWVLKLCRVLQYAMRTWARRHKNAPIFLHRSSIKYALCVFFLYFKRCDQWSFISLWIFYSSLFCTGYSISINWKFSICKLNDAFVIKNIGTNRQFYRIVDVAFVEFLIFSIENTLVI